MGKHRVTVLGLVVMAASVVWSLFSSNSDVPNDANIGAGVLLLAGIGLVIVGLASVYARRSSAQPPPPADPVL